MKQVVLTVAFVLIICGLGLLLNATQPQASPYLKPIAITALSLGALLVICTTLSGKTQPVTKHQDDAPVETLLPDLEQLKHDPRGDF